MTFEIVDLATGLVDVERSDDDKTGWLQEIAHWDGNLLDDVLAHCLDVVLQLSGNWDDWLALGNSTCNQSERQHELQQTRRELLYYDTNLGRI